MSLILDNLFQARLRSEWEHALIVINENQISGCKSAFSDIYLSRVEKKSQVEMVSQLDSSNQILIGQWVQVCSILTFYNNSLMIQGQEFCQFMHEDEDQNSIFFRISGEEERKLHSPIITGMKTSEQLPSSTNKKRQPKSEKSAQGKPRKRKDSEIQPKNANMKFGHWGLQENKKYHWFLQLYNSHFMNKHMRRMDKIFKTMSIFVGSREAEQCRSHHQKMEKKHNSFCKILLSLRKQHYGTEEPTTLESELTCNGYTSDRALISAQTLQEEDIRAPFDSYSPLQQGFPIAGDYSIEEEGCLQNQAGIDPIANLFNDEKYQNSLGLLNLF